MATLDVLTLTEARDAIGLSRGDTTHDDTLKLYVTAISDLLDRHCGPIVQRTITGELHDGANTMIFDLRYKPVASISTVTEYVNTTGTALAAQTNTAESTSDYLLDPSQGTIRRRSSNFDARFANGRLNIAVTYVAGRFADTASVSARFKTAAGMLVSHVWRSENAGGTATYGAGEQPSFGVGYLIPNRVLEMLQFELATPGFA